MYLLKLIVVVMTAWIGTMWSNAWTGLLMTLSLAVLCLSLAYEHRDSAPWARARRRAEA